MEDLELISKYRKSLMGIAIIFIVFFHNTIKFNNFYLNKSWESIINVLQVGVDIFLFLSGFGNFFSFKKNNSYIKFIKRKIKNILLPYIITIVVYVAFLFALKWDSLKNLLWRYSLISFFIDGYLDEWFIASIIMLYILFPLFIEIIKSKNKIISFCIFIYSLSAFFYFNNYNEIKIIADIFVCRIPVFVLGIYFGKKYYNGDRLEVRLSNKFLIVSIAFIYLFSIFIYTRILALPLSVFICIYLCRVFDKNKSNLNIFNFLGDKTLEIYLTNEKITIFSSIMFNRIIENITISSFLSNILSAILSIVCAIVIKNIVLIIETNIKKQCTQYIN